MSINVQIEPLLLCMPFVFTEYRHICYGDITRKYGFSFLLKYKRNTYINSKRESFWVSKLTTISLIPKSPDKQHTVWKLQKFIHTHFCQKFRETDVITKEVSKELISRNIFSVRVNFLFSTLCNKDILCEIDDDHVTDEDFFVFVTKK